ncbi:uncharacterized protein SCHCODRAFT_02594642 [Schizophyllum commune H4-8]|nr:uncharacterized protein SCHCODRAFT_02594642 [Schizophyllum commune H4-8]KAI5884817.1 hypothetical protein SCHCODRAFT_02594642 [Schizophyllum commune H4-8]
MSTSSSSPAVDFVLVESYAVDFVVEPPAVDLVVGSYAVDVVVVALLAVDFDVGSPAADFVVESLAVDFVVPSRRRLRRRGPRSVRRGRSGVALSTSLSSR